MKYLKVIDERVSNANPNLVYKINEVNVAKNGIKTQKVQKKWVDSISLQKIKY